jgi:RNase P subunit RPR2
MAATHGAWVVREDGTHVFSCGNCHRTTMTITREPPVIKRRAETKIVATCTNCGAWDNISYGAPEYRDRVKKRAAGR